MALPLADTHVVSMALNVPGPVAAQRLATLGARVTKVEPPPGDPFARLASSWYEALHRGYDLVRLDLRREQDVGRLHDLVAAADLLLTSQRARVLERIGLGWPALHGRHAAVCHVEIVGDPPPDDDTPGHDLTYLARVGLLDPPRMPRTLAVDLAGAERAAQLALALLLGRARSGIGGHARVSLAEVARDLALPLRHGLTTPDGPLGGGAAAYRIYRAREGWVALGAVEAHFAARVRDLLRVGESDDLAPAFLTRTADEWATWARQHDVPLAPLAEAPQPEPDQNEEEPR